MSLWYYVLEKDLPDQESWRSTIFSSTFFFLALPLESVNYFETMFVYGVRKWSNFIVLLVDGQLSLIILENVTSSLICPAHQLTRQAVLCLPLSSTVPHCWWPCHLHDLSPAWCLQVLKFESGRSPTSFFGFCRDCSDVVGLLNFYTILWSGQFLQKLVIAMLAKLVVNMKSTQRILAVLEMLSLQCMSMTGHFIQLQFLSQWVVFLIFLFFGL